LKKIKIFLDSFLTDGYMAIKFVYEMDFKNRNKRIETAQSNLPPKSISACAVFLL